MEREEIYTGRKGFLSKSNRGSSGWKGGDKSCLEFQAMVTRMACCGSYLFCRLRAPRALPSCSSVLPVYLLHIQLCLMCGGREQLIERAESSWVRAELKEQPQFWKKEGEFLGSLETGGAKQGNSQES